MIDDKMVQALGSHPGTFPEMIRATYAAGRKAGVDGCRKDLRELGIFATALMVALVVVSLGQSTEPAVEAQPTLEVVTTQGGPARGDEP